MLSALTIPRKLKTSPTNSSSKRLSYPNMLNSRKSSYLHQMTRNFPKALYTSLKELKFPDTLKCHKNSKIPTELPGYLLTPHPSLSRQSHPLKSFALKILRCETQRSRETERFAHIVNTIAPPSFVLYLVFIL